MAEHHRSHDRAVTTESKFYLPATVPPSAMSSPFERLWASLFDHRVGTSR